VTKNPADLQAGLESDDNLMARVGKGDAGAFETLYGRWSRRVMAYAFRALSDKGEAEDVVQETFLSVFRASSRYRPCERFGAFLFRIAGNAVRSRIRRKCPIPLDFSEGEEEESRFPSDTEGDWTHFEERERLHAALETLPFPQRNALLLAVTGGLSYREIALQEGISEDAVAARICRARKALRKALAASGCEEEEKVDA
jgi:RNA polymerase sigma-70 factor (ECF subfamily)